jgi:hypothetical protein
MRTLILRIYRKYSNQYERNLNKCNLLFVCNKRDYYFLPLADWNITIAIILCFFNNIKHHIVITLIIIYVDLNNIFCPFMIKVKKERSFE